VCLSLMNNRGGLHINRHLVRRDLQSLRLTGSKKITLGEISNSIIECILSSNRIYDRSIDLKKFSSLRCLSRSLNVIVDDSYTIRAPKNCNIVPSTSVYFCTITNVIPLPRFPFNEVLQLVQ